MNDLPSEFYPLCLIVAYSVVGFTVGTVMERLLPLKDSPGAIFAGALWPLVVPAALGIAIGLGLLIAWDCLWHYFTSQPLPRPLPQECSKPRT